MAHYPNHKAKTKFKENYCHMQNPLTSHVDELHEKLRKCLGRSVLSGVFLSSERSAVWDITCSRLSSNHT